MRAALDPGRLIGDGPARAALAALGAGLRAAGYRGEPLGGGADPTAAALVDLALGEPVDRRALRGALGGDAVDALRAVDAVGPAPVGDRLVLGAQLLPTGNLLTLLPRGRADLEHVYLGPDSMLLLEVVWPELGVGDRAVDLATGNGLLAAVLALRHDHVVAADLSARCVATAACLPVLNPQLRGRLSVVRTDVAAGLAAGAFDVVTANAPWVPEPMGRGAMRLFAAGGPTGFELPRRFLDAAAGLLAPGGRAFLAASDLELADGSRPLHDHLPNLEADHGVTASVVETRLGAERDLLAWARQRVPGTRAARHVVVVMCRP